MIGQATDHKQYLHAFMNLNNTSKMQTMLPFFKLTLASDYTFGNDSAGIFLNNSMFAGV